MFELAGIIILGILAQWIAWRIRVPAILPLILIGLGVGPVSAFFTKDGHKLIEPMIQDDGGIFPEKYLFAFVSLAIGIILFEGGLTLKRRELALVGPDILKLITIGSITTFFGAGLAAHYVVQLSWPISFLFASLIIVTGPTVIAPILQNVPLNRNVSAVLKWEGILIDPIGALVAVLVFEFIRSAQWGVELTTHVFASFFETLLLGLAIGAVAAYMLYLLIRAGHIPHYLLNVFTLALVLGVFVFSHWLAHESGLLSVVVMGMVLGNMDVPRLKEILSFKESLSVLLISILFIVLAANIDQSDIEIILNNWRPLALFAIIALVLRPLGVFLSTIGSGLQLREKLFVSWVGPRGIVAAGIASLFGITLVTESVPDAEYLTPLVFLVVLGTVLLNATTARVVARVLKVTLEGSSGVLLIGANAAARLIAKFLQDNNRHVVLVDNSESNVKKAREMGLEAFVANIYSEGLEEYFELLDMGYMIAMTSSPEINQYVVHKYQKIFGENGAFRLITPEELKHSPDGAPSHGLFSYTDDFLNFNEAARDYPTIHEAPAAAPEEMERLVRLATLSPKSVPLFIRTDTGSLETIPPRLDGIEARDGFSFVYLGKKLEFPSAHS